MRKTIAAGILSASTIIGAAATEVIFDYMEHSTAQDLRDCSDSIGENGCRIDFLSGYVEPIVNSDNGVYTESISTESIAQAADMIDESTNGVQSKPLLMGGLIGFMIGGAVIFYDATEGKDRRDRKKIAEVASV
jgi:hypothetical protein